MPIFPAFSTATPSRQGSRAIVLLLTCCCALFGALPSAWAENLDEVSQLIKSGQHAKALEQVDRFLAGKPKDAQGRFLKGIILTGLNKHSDAISVFKKLTEDYPELPEPYNNLAVIYAQQKQYDKAKEALEMAIRTHPAYATAHENLGDIYSRLASQAYGKALQIDSTNASAQTKLAMINDLVGNTKVGAGRTAPTGGTAPLTPVVVAATEPVKPPATVKAEPPAKPEPTTKPAVEPPKPVEMKSTAPAKSGATKSAEGSSDVTATIDGWLAAWSRKDVKAYLSYYARDFQTPNGQSRKEWENDRSLRVGKPGKIEVGRDKLNVKTEDDGKLLVRFRQSYKSATLSTSSSKTLVLVKHGGNWLIQQERVGG